MGADRQGRNRTTSRSRRRAANALLGKRLVTIHTILARERRERAELIPANNMERGSISFPPP
jgi:hypothetical protein